VANHPDPAAVNAEFDRLTEGFFRAVSFEEGTTPLYESIYELFIEAGLLIKNTSSTPEISRVSQFIEPRLAAVRSGDLTRFNEVELCETTEIFGNVAHRFSSYAKSGTMKGIPFTARGMVSTQFVQTPGGWKISAMAWDDERPGLQSRSTINQDPRGLVSDSNLRVRASEAVWHRRQLSAMKRPSMPRPKAAVRWARSIAAHPRPDKSGHRPFGEIAGLQSA